MSKSNTMNTIFLTFPSFSISSQYQPISLSCCHPGIVRRMLRQSTQVACVAKPNHSKHLTSYCFKMSTHTTKCLAQPFLIFRVLSCHKKNRHVLRLPAALCHHDSGFRQVQESFLSTTRGFSNKHFIISVFVDLTLSLTLMRFALRAALCISASRTT